MDLMDAAWGNRVFNSVDSSSLLNYHFTAHSPYTCIVERGTETYIITLLNEVFLKRDSKSEVRIVDLARKSPGVSVRRVLTEGGTTVLYS